MPSDEKEFPLDSENIETVALGDLLTEAYRYPTYYGINYVEEGIPEVRGELLLPNGGIESDPSKFRYITSATASKFPKTELQAGDLVISVRGTMGKIGFVPGWLKGANITANLMRLAPDRTRVTPEYLKYYLMSDLFRYRLNELSPQTTIKTIQAPVLKSIPVRLPSLLEQRAIAHILDTVQEAKEATEKVIAATRQFKASLAKHLFTYSPVPVDQADQVPLKETEIGPIPEHWDLVPLVELVDVKGGKRLPKGHAFADRPTPYPYIRVVDFNDWSVETADLRYLTVGDYDVIKRYIIHSSDVYISIAGTIGLVGSVPDELNGANLTENAARIIIKDSENLLKDYLICYLAAYRGQHEIRLRTSKTSQPKLALARIKQIPICLPPALEQRNIVQNLYTIHNKIVCETSGLNVLNALFQSLLHHLMTGKIRVNQELEVIYGTR